ncbi:Uncharacterised protein [Mycobacteroides abscessus subsp. abscessus]|nr:Uncharacterised protein [Mycobacteroides abscessus subsp. abscessus]
MAAKSSYTLCRLAFCTEVCHSGPYSPPPRMLVITQVPPRSSQPMPDAPL